MVYSFFSRLLMHSLSALLQYSSTFEQKKSLVVMKVKTLCATMGTEAPRVTRSHSRQSRKFSKLPSTIQKVPQFLSCATIESFWIRSKQRRAKETQMRSARGLGSKVWRSEMRCTCPNCLRSLRLLAALFFASICNFTISLSRTLSRLAYSQRVCSGPKRWK